MRKASFFVLGVVSLVVVGSLILREGEVKDLSPALFFPQDVLAVVEQKNLKTKIDELSITRLGKAIRGIDYVQIATDIGLQEKDISTVRTLQMDISRFLSSPAFEYLLGNEFICGFFKPKGVPLEYLNENLEGSFLLIAKPKHNVKIAANLVSVFSQTFSKSSTQYGRYIIHRFDLKNTKTLAAAVVDGLILIALDERNIRRSLDRYDNKAFSLADNTEYLDLKNNFKYAEFFAYFSVDRLREKSSQLNLKTASVDSIDTGDEMSTWNGWRGGALGAWQEGNIIQEKAVLLFDEDELNPHVQEMVAFLPENSEELSFAAKDSLAYYWTNTFHFQSVVDMYLSELGEDQAEKEDLQARFKELSDIELEDFISSIGNNIGIIIQKLNPEEFIPVPDLAFFFEVTDGQIVKTVFEKSLLHWGIPFESSLYKNVEFFFWGHELQAGMQPVVAFFNNYLFTASSVSMIKEVIDTKMDGENLGGDENFKMVSKPLMEDNNTIVYLKVGDLVEVMKELISWGGTMIAIKDRETAHVSTILIDKLIHPLLDGLKMYSVMGARTYTIDGQMITTSRTVVSEI